MSQHSYIIPRNRMRFAIGIAILSALCGQALPGSAQAATLDVKADCGASGSGSTPDTLQINQCIALAAATTPPREVVFPSGTYLSGSIHLMSNVTLRLDKDATILAAPGGLGVYDSPETNSNDMYQDFTHSHFRNALMWGENLTNVTIEGEGVIDGNAQLLTNVSVPETPDGFADKAISFKEGSNITLSGITIMRGGHIALHANGVDTMTVSGVRILSDPLIPGNPLTSRNGFSLVNSSHVTIDEVDILGLPNDALALKSNYALGSLKTSTDIRVTDSKLSSVGGNAAQFGSETCGDFNDISFQNIAIYGAGKAGIGITSNDGAEISNISYGNISMTGTAMPIWIKTNDRGRCGSAHRVGYIHDIQFTDVISNAGLLPLVQYTSTISGTPTVPIENVTLTNVNLNVLGGGLYSAGLNPPEAGDDPADQGPKPSYGWWLRHVGNIKFIDSKVQFALNDRRPALIAVDGAGVKLDSLKFAVGLLSPYDLGFSGSTTYTYGAGTVSIPFGIPPRIQILP